MHIKWFVRHNDLHGKTEECDRDRCVAVYRADELGENEQALVDANNALYGQNRELERQLEEQRGLILAHAEEVQHMQENIDNLSRKIEQSRGEPAMERLRHQNNEMRVSMSRMHRLMKAGNLAGAMEAWELTNRWLESCVIDPYLGTVPGVEHVKDVAQS